MQLSAYRSRHIHGNCHEINRAFYFYVKKSNTRSIRIDEHRWAHFNVHAVARLVYVLTRVTSRRVLSYGTDFDNPFTKKSKHVPRGDVIVEDFIRTQWAWSIMLWWQDIMADDHRRPGQPGTLTLRWREPRARAQEKEREREWVYPVVSFQIYPSQCH